MAWGQKQVVDQKSDTEHKNNGDEINPCQNTKLLLIFTIIYKHIHMLVAKGQIISKFLFGVFNFLQKTNKNMLTWDFIVVK